ncbi:rhodanese-like domain-containing protein [Desulfonatronovibrio hydrogenovorans]|uniref:rhodanese-like domain-containing protein n=1 Tax=Desulfonatronovibrio hydrogenovorans TaxID=53245 RepID=UPI001376B2F7|nr:rhodanese-like domain-containing protein [Desulfonatronovibrio hydrogenovorans]
MYFKSIVSIMSVILLLISCTAGDDGPFIDQDGLEKLLLSHDDLIIIDVREVFERTGPLGKIRGSMNIPLAEIRQTLPDAGFSKNKPIVLLCRTQNRSMAAYNMLQEMGYTRVYVLMGGMADYEHQRTSGY